MRIKPFLKTFLLLLFFFQFADQAKATHLYGAEFTYEYIGPSGDPAFPFRYKIVYKIYTGTIGNNINASVDFRFYQKNGTLFKFLVGQQPAQPPTGPLTLPVPAGCTVTGLPTLHLWIYERTVDFPISFEGYYATATIVARNTNITNLQNPGARDLFSYMEIPAPFIESKSPVFTDTAVVVMFAGDTTTIINSAFDRDGDKLIYAFNQPFENHLTGIYSTFVPSASVPSRIPYMATYSLAQPFGPGGFASIQASTGLAKYYVPNPGNYVVSFQVKEYRNINGVDVQIGSTIRDIQLVVRNAPANNNTKPTFTTNATQTITIVEGQAIPPLNFTFTDPNPGNQLRITASSPLLDGPGGKNATFGSSSSSPTVINNAVSGTSVTFNYTSACGEANLYPLDITVWDGICGTTPHSNSYTIQVLPYQGPQKIFGDTTVCSTSLETYHIAGKASATYNWRLSGGGALLGNKNNDSIRVQWATPGRYKLTAIETTAGSCTDSVSFFVNVAPGIPLTVNASATSVCVGTPVTLTASGGTNLTWTDGTNSFTGATLTVTPTATTTYTVTGSGTSGCNGNNTVTITVNPLPSVNAGADRNVCSGSSTTLTATGSTTGNTLLTWTDGTNTYTGNNVSVSPQVTTTYTLTLQNLTTGCSSTDQVTLTVVPSPVPSVASIPDALCKNAAAVALPANTTVNGVAASSLNPATLAVGNHTVVVSATNAQNCTGTTSKIVTIHAAPTPNFGTLANAYCKDAPAVALNAAGSVYTVNGATATSFNPATLAVGNHTVSVTTTNAQGCAETATRTVVINPLPAPSLAFLNAAYCKNDAAVTFPAATGRTYTINGTAATSFNPATLAVGNHTVSLAETNSNNCTATISRTITINEVPAPAFTNLNTSYCQNAGTVTLTSNIAGSTFTIDGTAATVLNPATLSVGNHTVVVSNTNASGCTGTASQVVQIKAIPTANFGSLATAYCKNDPAFSLNIPGSTFTINGTAATSFDPATLSVGNHTVSVITTNADGCSVTGTRTVAVHAIPAPSLAFLANAYCQNAGVVTLPAGTGKVYQIDGITVSSLNPATLSVGTHTVSLIETNANNCVVTATRTITIQPVPLTDAIAGAVSICPGLTGVKYSIVNPRETNYQWSISAGHGTIVAGQGTTEITVNWNGAAAATVSAQAVNAQNCTGPVFSLPVTINPILTTPQPIGPASICRAQATNVRYVMPNPTIGSTFTWTVTGGTVASSNVKGDTVYINWTNVGANSIVVQEASTGTVNCFGNSPSFAVTILPSPIQSLIITGPSDMCLNTPENFTLPGAANSTYAWSVTHNSTTTSLPGTSGTISFTATAPGIYTLSVIETNASGCAGTPITKTINVEPTPTVSQLFGPTMVCPENLSNHLFYVQRTAGFTYKWIVSGGSMVTSGSINDSIYVNFSNSPTKQVTVTPVSANGCEGTPFMVNVNLDAATLELATITTGAQNHKVIELNLQMASNTANTKTIDVYRREAGNGAFTKLQSLPNTATTFTDNGVQTGNNVYEYRLESLNECGTVLSTSTHKTMLLHVVANEAAKTVRLNWNAYKGWNVTRYEIYAQADNGTFELLPNQNLSAADTAVTLANIASRGFNQCFRIKAISADARVSWSNEACVNFVNELKFYNLITPNGDGYNDAFVIENIQLYPGAELSIYNRWGTEVYRKTNYDNTWTAKDQSAGTYYFLLKMKDGRSFKNWVEVVK